MLKNKNIILLICSVLIFNSNILKSKVFNDPSYLKSYLIYLKGNSYFNKNKFDEAINYYKKAYKIFNKYPEPYYKLAKIYYNKQNYNVSEQYLTLSDKYKEFFRNINDLAGFYKISGEHYQRREKYHKALDHYDHYYSIISNNIIIDHKIGYLSYKIEQYDKAFKYLKKFIYNDKLNRKEFKDEIKKSYMIIINIYMDKKEYEKSLYFLKELYIFYPEKDIKERITVLNNNLKYYK